MRIDFVWHASDRPALANNWMGVTRLYTALVSSFLCSCKFYIWLFGLPSCCRGSIDLQAAFSSPRLLLLQLLKQITPYFLNERFLAKFTRLKSRKYHLHFACTLLSLWSGTVSLILFEQTDRQTDRHADTTTIILAVHAWLRINKEGGWQTWHHCIH